MNKMRIILQFPQIPANYHRMQLFSPVPEAEPTTGQSWATCVLLLNFRHYLAGTLRTCVWVVLLGRYPSFETGRREARSIIRSSTFPPTTPVQELSYIPVTVQILPIATINCDHSFHFHEYSLLRLPSPAGNLNGDDGRVEQSTA